MWEWIKDCWGKEWPEVRDAPFSFAICLVIGIVCGAMGTFFLYNYFVIPGKDSTISSLQSTINSLQQERDSLGGTQKQNSELQNNLKEAQNKISELEKTLKEIPKQTFTTPDALTSPLIQNMNIHISDLARDDFVIHDKTFENCHIYGPAIISVEGSFVCIGTTFTAAVPDPNAFFVETTNEFVLGVIVFKDCVIRNCTLHKISFIGNHELITELKKEMNK